MFKEYTKQIEQLVGGKIEWIGATKATCFMIIYSCDISEECKWEHAIEW